MQFVSRKELRVHAKSHSSYDCRLCNKTLKTRRNWKRHMDTHRHSGTTKNFKCFTCGKTFMEKAYLEVHEKLHEKREKIFTCARCDKLYYTKANLKRHILTHEKPQFHCDICQKSFTLNCELQRHNYRIHQEKTESFTCTKCTKTFSDRMYLNRHMERTHPDPAQRVKCNICRVPFSHKYKLQCHMKTHQEGKFLCMECNRKFYRSDHLKKHVCKQYKCPTCDQRFALKKTLKRHLKKHMKSERRGTQLKCPTCNKTFDAQQKLNQHIKKHRREMSSNTRGKQSKYPKKKHWKQGRRNPGRACRRNVDKDAGQGFHEKEHSDTEQRDRKQYRELGAVEGVHADTEQEHHEQVLIVSDSEQESVEQVHTKQADLERDTDTDQKSQEQETDLQAVEEVHIDKEQECQDEVFIVSDTEPQSPEQETETGGTDTENVEQSYTDLRQVHHEKVHIISSSEQGSLEHLKPNTEPAGLGHVHSDMELGAIEQVHTISDTEQKGFEHEYADAQQGSSEQDEDERGWKQDTEQGNQDEVLIVSDMGAQEQEWLDLECQENMLTDSDMEQEGSQQDTEQCQTGTEQGGSDQDVEEGSPAQDMAQGDEEHVHIDTLLGAIEQVLDSGKGDPEQIYTDIDIQLGAIEQLNAASDTEQGSSEHVYTDMDLQCQEEMPIESDMEQIGPEPETEHVWTATEQDLEQEAQDMAQGGLSLVQTDIEMGALEHEYRDAEQEKIYTDTNLGCQEEIVVSDTEQGDQERVHLTDTKQGTGTEIEGRKEVQEDTGQRHQEEVHIVSDKERDGSEQGTETRGLEQLCTDMKMGAIDESDTEIEQGGWEQDTEDGGQESDFENGGLEQDIVSDTDPESLEEIYTDTQLGTVERGDMDIKQDANQGSQEHEQTDTEQQLYERIHKDIDNLKKRLRPRKSENNNNLKTPVKVQALKKIVQRDFKGRSKKVFTAKSNIVLRQGIHKNRKRVKKHCQSQKSKLNSHLNSDGKVHSVKKDLKRGPRCHSEKSFSNKSNVVLIEGINKERQKVKTPCQSKKTKQKSNSKSHEKVHAEKKDLKKDSEKDLKIDLANDFKCGTCDKTFAKKYSLQIHKKIHKKRKNKFSCIICKKMYYTRENLKRHALTHESPKFKCDICFKKFTLNCELKRHSVIHQEKIIFYHCPTCSKAFSQPNYLKRHIERTHPDPTQAVKCTICDMLFSHKYKLQCHMKTHQEGKFRCANCERKFYRSDHLKKHVCKTLKCPKCSQNFAKLNTLTQHMAKHGEKDESKNMKSSKSFPSKAGQKSHLSTKYENDSDNLDGGEKANHIKDKKVPCTDEELREEVRKKAIAYLKELESLDQKIYTSSVRITCKQCLRVFFSKSAHKNHKLECH